MVKVAEQSHKYSLKRATLDHLGYFQEAHGNIEAYMLLHAEVTLQLAELKAFRITGKVKYSSNAIIFSEAAPFPGRYISTMKTSQYIQDESISYHSI